VCTASECVFLRSALTIVSQLSVYASEYVFPHSALKIVSQLNVYCYRMCFSSFNLEDCLLIDCVPLRNMVFLVQPWRQFINWVCTSSECVFPRSALNTSLKWVNCKKCWAKTDKWRYINSPDLLYVNVTHYIIHKVEPVHFYKC
jgi:hypothetical protein